MIKQKVKYIPSTKKYIGFTNIYPYVNGLSFASSIPIENIVDNIIIKSGSDTVYHISGKLLSKYGSRENNVYEFPQIIKTIPAGRACIILSFSSLKLDIMNIISKLIPKGVDNYIFEYIGDDTIDINIEYGKEILSQGYTVEYPVQINSEEWIIERKYLNRSYGHMSWCRYTN